MHCITHTFLAILAPTELQLLSVNCLHAGVGTAATAAASAEGAAGFWLPAGAASIMQPVQNIAARGAEGACCRKALEDGSGGG